MLESVFLVPQKSMYFWWLRWGLCVELILSSPPGQEGPDGAFQTCPCIEVDWSKIDNGSYADGYANGSIPLGYGSGRCESFDTDGDVFKECRDAVKPSWCEAKWCYINKDNCALEARESNIVRGDRLFYSYHTCGYLGLTLDGMACPGCGSLDRPIRAYAWGNIADFSPKDPSLLVRMMLRYADILLKELDVARKDIKYIDRLTNASSRFASSYTGCVHDIALGQLDICLADQWDTDERRSMLVGFSGNIYAEPLYLLVKKEAQNDTFWTNMGAAFAPFTPSLWLLVLAVFTAYSIAMFVFEYQQPGGHFFFHDDEDQRWKLSRSFLESLYLSFKSYVKSGTEFEAVTPSGKLVSLSLGFFVLVMTATYTAETASILISLQNVAVVSNIGDAFERNHRVCYSSAAQEMLESGHPLLKQFGIPRPGSWDSDVANYAEAILDGRCDSSIIGEYWLSQFQAEGKYCDLELVGSALISFPTGFFVGPYLQKHIAWANAKKRSKGAWEAVRKAMVPPSTCHIVNAAGNAHGRIGISHVAGLVCLLGVMIVIASGMRWVEKCIVPHRATKYDNTDKELRRTVSDMISKVTLALSTETCKHCGNRFMQDAAFCRHCGKPRTSEGPCSQEEEVQQRAVEEVQQRAVDSLQVC